MRKMVFVLAVLVLGLAGCKKGSGIWFLVISPPTTFSCEQAPAEHNYTGAVEPTAGGPVVNPWTFESDDTESDALGFAQFVDTKDGQRVLILGGGAYPGTKEGGKWIFAWDGNESSTDTQTHESGYSFSDTGSTNAEDSFEVEFSGNTASGTWTSSLVDVQQWTESDAWDPVATGIGLGQTPVSSYLIDGQQNPVVNDPAATNCNSDPCTLSITTNCNQSSEFEAFTVKDGDAFNGLENAGQPFGAP